MDRAPDSPGESSFHRIAEQTSVDIEMRCLLHHFSCPLARMPPTALSPDAARGAAAPHLSIFPTLFDNAAAHDSRCRRAFRNALAAMPHRYYAASLRAGAGRRFFAACYGALPQQQQPARQQRESGRILMARRATRENRERRSGYGGSAEGVRYAQERRDARCAPAAGDAVAAPRRVLHADAAQRTMQPSSPPNARREQEYLIEVVFLREAAQSRRARVSATRPSQRPISS